MFLGDLKSQFYRAANMSFGAKPFSHSSAAIHTRTIVPGKMKCGVKSIKSNLAILFHGMIGQN